MLNLRWTRRRFLQVAGGAAALATVGCEPEEQTGTGTPGPITFTDDFPPTTQGWGPEWVNVRYESEWWVADGVASIKSDPVEPKAVQEGKEVALYLGSPVVATGLEGQDVTVSASVSIDGAGEAGLIARASYDQAYALLVDQSQVLLCRYDVTDRVVLDRATRPGEGNLDLELRVSGSTVVGVAEHASGSVELSAQDDDLPGPGMVGVVLNPRSDLEGATARFSTFLAGGLSRSQTRFAYRFAGAIVGDDDGTFRARLAARTVEPAAIDFELSTDEGFSSVITVEGGEPKGDLGSVRAWAKGLAGETTYFWRPISGEARGPVARFKTPPPPGAPVRFVFASCTSGRVTEYPSFERARALEPEFYLHMGDWGYADLTSLSRRADHFQSRWLRLLRERNVEGLIAQTPLMFWQDDHDYQADNGWSGTVQPYAVEAFDDLHANPTPEYFDLRWGDVHVWALDCRLYATDPEAPDGPDKSRIGPVQKAWLKAGMAASDAPVQIVASAMVFRNKPDDDPGWHNVYEVERDELLEFFSSLPATVAIVSGDSHGQRLIHHFEFGSLYEFNCSGTDFPNANQGNNDPVHTEVNLSDSGFGLVELGAAGPERTLTISSISTPHGRTLFEKSLPVAGQEIE